MNTHDTPAAPHPPPTPHQSAASPTPLSRGRDDEAFIRQLYHDHGRSVLAYSLRLTRDRASAEDVTQETFLRAWRNTHSLHRIGSVRGWLLTVARNIIIDRARAQSVRPLEVPHETSDPFLGTLATPDHGPDVASAITMLAALQMLPPPNRQVLIEVYYQGRSIAETARRLAISESTVRSRLSAALRTLRSLLADPTPQQHPRRHIGDPTNGDASRDGPRPLPIPTVTGDEAAPRSTPNRVHHA